MGSAISLLPKTFALIKKGVHIISARDLYESETSIDKWKSLAFLNLKKDCSVNLDDDTTTNLIVIGDSKYEMEAGELLSKKTEKCIIKSIKLNECPSTQELIK